MSKIKSKDVHEISSKTFTDFYEIICERLRSSGTLDQVIDEFEQCKDDLERVRYASKMKEYEVLFIEKKKGKNEEEAQELEKKYDAIIGNEKTSKEARRIIFQSIQNTDINNKQAFATRYMKRAWTSILQENFENAFNDAQRSLSYNDVPSTLLWNAYEILGHCYAKQGLCKSAEDSFKKALEGLRHDNCSNEIKVAATMRISSVFKTIKGRKDMKEKKNKPKKETHNPKVPFVSYGKHQILESASSAVKVTESETCGRSLIASRDIKPGDILIVEEPFTSTLNPDCLNSHCITCFRRTDTPVPCPSCSLVWFCNESCIEKEKLHHHECGLLHLLIDECLGRMGLLVFRIFQEMTLKRLKLFKNQITNRKKEKPSETGEWKWPERKYSSHDYLSTYHLVTNDDKRTFGDLFKRSLSALYIVKALDASGYFDSDNEEDRLMVAELALRHLQGTSCNAYGINEYVNLTKKKINGIVELGGAIYPTISLTNHSCDPNTIRYCVGSTCILRATRKIEKGTQVYDNYGPEFSVMSRPERIKYLENQYKFQCNCTACEEDWPIYPHRHESFTFACPEENCKQPSSYLEGSKMECTLCGNSESYQKVVKKIRSAMDEYNKSLGLMKKGEMDKALPLLLRQQTFLDQYAIPPGKILTDTHNAIKQCIMTSEGNSFTD